MRSNLLYDKVIPSERYEQHMAPILIQGIAALEPASFDQILARVTRLKVMKPTRNMTPQETTIFIEDITEHIHVKGINYQFIDRGIFNLIEQGHCGIRLPKHTGTPDAAEFFRRDKLTDHSDK
jgi:hypothetical protein